MGSVRSLADDLRLRDDEDLAGLVRARPDLLLPVPADITTLALRAGSPASVAACLRGYDQLGLHVALAAAMGPESLRPADLVAAVAEHVPAADGPQRVRDAVHRLRAEAILWGTSRTLHIIGAARDLLVPHDRGPRAAALDPIVAGFARDPESLRRVLDDAPAGARALVDRLLPGPVVGTVEQARRAPDPARSPVDWLLAHHILLPVGDGRVVLPAEVVAVLRGDPGATAGGPISLVPPQPASPPEDRGRVDAGAVGAVLDHLHRTEKLCRAWADSPAGRLRTGGIALRDVTATARALGCGETDAGLVMEVALAAGLIAADTGDVVAYLPTRAFDIWVIQPPADRHAHLLAAWLSMQGIAMPGDRPLAPEHDRPAVADLRRDVLRVLERSGAPFTAAEVLASLEWWAPRRAVPERPDWTARILAEATALGIVSAGVLTSAGRALVAGDGAGVIAALARALPPVVDDLVMQADLTAVVPGLPSVPLAAFMRTAADAESTGAASVYRFSAASIRRALDTGLSAGELLDELSRRGSVPQPLEYLISDTARRHATLRIGQAGTYLRCEDPVLLATLLADPSAAALALLRLSDTVLASPHPPDVVMDRLRGLGHAPVPEVGLEPVPHGPRRARDREFEPATQEVTPALAEAAVRAMRAGERPAGRRGTEPPDHATGRGDGAVHPVAVQEHGEVLAGLRAAIGRRGVVWIGYADPLGTAGDHRIEPLRLSGGYLTALDLRTEEIHAFAVARITGVQPA